jgi:hypothetical protein
MYVLILSSRHNFILSLLKNLGLGDEERVLTSKLIVSTI